MVRGKFEMAGQSGELPRKEERINVAMKSIQITPNFANMRKRFQQDSEWLANYITRQHVRQGTSIQPTDVRRLIVGLNIALQSVDTTEALNEYREFFSKIATLFAQADDAATAQFAQDMLDIADADSADRADRYYSERDGW